MIDCNLGPDFKSCFLGHKQSEYGKTFTVRLAKHMCYEDARLVQHFVNQKAMRQWIDAVTDFCEGNNVLRDCLIGMTACYVDYFTKERGTKSAKAIMQQQTKKLESILNGTYVPEKAEAEPFASNPNLKSDISLTSLIVDVDSLICDSAIVNGIVRGYATVAEKANVKEGTLVEGDTYYIQS